MPALSSSAVHKKTSHVLLRPRRGEPVRAGEKEKEKARKRQKENQEKQRIRTLSYSESKLTQVREMAVLRRNEPDWAQSQRMEVYLC